MRAPISRRPSSRASRAARTGQIVSTCRKNFLDRCPRSVFLFRSCRPPPPLRAFPTASASSWPGCAAKWPIRAARDRAIAPLLLLLWSRLGRILNRFVAIAARHRDRIGSPRPASQTRRRPNTVRPPRDPLPRRRGWLVRRLPQCAAHGEYLRLFLSEPDMIRLIESEPQLRRLLRPLWLMLRTEPVPEVLRPPPSPPASPPLGGLGCGAGRPG